MEPTAIAGLLTASSVLLAVLVPGKEASHRGGEGVQGGGDASQEEEDATVDLQGANRCTGLHVPF